MASPFNVTFNTKDVSNWSVINDGVMGGLSKGRLTDTDSGVLFYGTVSLENNGGFASYRSPFMRYELGDFEYVSVKYRSEEMAIAFQLDTEQAFYLPNYKMSLPPSKEWTVKKMKLTDLAQYRLGYPTGKDLTKDQLARVIRLGFITNEKRAGDFKIEIASITFE